MSVNVTINTANLYFPKMLTPKSVRLSLYRPSLIRANMQHEFLLVGGNKRDVSSFHTDSLQSVHAHHTSYVWMGLPSEL